MTPDSDNILEVVLTGGPCAGKSTALAFLHENLTDRGYRVFLVPEAATLLITNAYPDVVAILSKPESSEFWDMERAIMSMQHQLRQQFLDMARRWTEATGQKCVLLHDRGLADNIAYIGFDRWSRIMEDLGLTTYDGRDSYDLIVHMVTAALGAEEFYTQENNEARHETVEQAAEVDGKTAAAWHGSPHLRIVDNSTDFSEKLDRVLQCVLEALGIPHPLEKERAFELLEGVPSSDNLATVNATPVKITQWYLPHLADGSEERIRMRKSGGATSYYHTIKTKQTTGARIERERVLTARQFDELYQQRERVLEKTRYCFTHEGHYMELDVYPDGRARVEVEGVEMDDAITFPEWLGEVREVTGQPGYSNYDMSQPV